MQRSERSRAISRRLINKAIPVASVAMLSTSIRLPVTEAQGSGGLEDVVIAVTGSTGNEVSMLELESGVVSMFEVGHAPWGIVRGEGPIAFVSTAEGLAEVDLSAQAVVSFTPFSMSVSELAYGEYRPGGMGLTILGDSGRVAVGRYYTTGTSTVEVFDPRAQAVEAVFEVGIRPFQLLSSDDGRQVFSINHDSFSVTKIDLRTDVITTVQSAPLGTSGFDKPHYASFDEDGKLVLPYQGVETIRLDPVSAEFESYSSTSNSHQHGIVRIPGSDSYAIVGTGPAGRATGGPNLTIQDLDAGHETIWPLDRPHEDVVLTSDASWALLSGGYSFQNLGWDGVTAVNLTSGEQRSWAVPNRPLGIVVV